MHVLGIIFFAKWAWRGHRRLNLKWQIFAVVVLNYNRFYQQPNPRSERKSVWFCAKFRCVSLLRFISASVLRCNSRIALQSITISCRLKSVDLHQFWLLLHEIRTVCLSYEFAVFGGRIDQSSFFSVSYVNMWCNRQHSKNCLSCCWQNIKRIPQFSKKHAPHASGQRLIWMRKKHDLNSNLK